MTRVWQCLKPYQEQGWVQLECDLEYENKLEMDLESQGELDLAAIAPSRGQLRLTDPEGFLFSNVVLTALFEALE
jgi:hypothetical protein